MKYNEKIKEDKGLQIQKDLTKANKDFATAKARGGMVDADYLANAPKPTPVNQPQGLWTKPSSRPDTLPARFATGKDVAGWSLKDLNSVVQDTSVNPLERQTAEAFRNIKAVEQAKNVGAAQTKLLQAEKNKGLFDFLSKKTPAPTQFNVGSVETFAPSKVSIGTRLANTGIGQSVLNNRAVQAVANNSLVKAAMPWAKRAGAVGVALDAGLGINDLLQGREQEQMWDANKSTMENIGTVASPMRWGMYAGNKINKLGNYLAEPSETPSNGAAIRDRVAKMGGGNVVVPDAATMKAEVNAAKDAQFNQIMKDYYKGIGPVGGAGGGGGAVESAGPKYGGDVYENVDLKNGTATIYGSGNRGVGERYQGLAPVEQMYGNLPPEQQALIKEMRQLNIWRKDYTNAIKGLIGEKEATERTKLSGKNDIEEKKLAWEKEKYNDPREKYSAIVDKMSYTTVPDPDVPGGYKMVRDAKFGIEQAAKLGYLPPAGVPEQEPVTDENIIKRFAQLAQQQPRLKSTYRAKMKEMGFTEQQINDTLGK